MIEISRKNISKILQGIIIIISFLGGFIKFDQYFNPWTSFHKVEQKSQLLKNEDYSIFIMGNSHAIAAFNPQLLNEISVDENYLNLSALGGEITPLYFYLKKALNQGQLPKIVILDIFTLRITSRSHALAILEYDYLEFLKDLIKVLPQDEHNAGLSFLLTNLNIEYTIYNLNENIQYFKSLEGINNSNIVKNKGFYENKNIVMKDDYQSTYRKGYWPINFHYYERVTQAIINLCKKNNIELIIVSSPVVNGIGINDDIGKNFAEYFELEFIDLNPDVLNDIDTPQFLFADSGMQMSGRISSHTNYLGAQYSSLKLIDALDQLGFIHKNQNLYQLNWDEMQTKISSLEE